MLVGIILNHRDLLDIYHAGTGNLFLQIKGLVNDNLILLQVTNNDLLIGKELVGLIQTKGTTGIVEGDLITINAFLLQGNG